MAKNNDKENKIRRTNSIFLPDILNEFTKFIDRHLREVRYVSYGLGLVGVAVLARNARATQKFCSVAELPERFIQQHVRLQGRVKDVSPSGILLVDHIPILDWKFQNRNKTGFLSIHLAGTELLPPALPWLQSHLMGRQVWFRILSQNEIQGLDSVVTTKKNMVQTMCINEYLIQEGLATVQPINCAPSDIVCTGFFDRLHNAELKAERKGKGTWARPSGKERLQSTIQRVRSFPSRAVHAAKDALVVKYTAVKQNVFGWGIRAKKRTKEDS